MPSEIMSFTDAMKLKPAPAQKMPPMLEDADPNAAADAWHRAIDPKTQHAGQADFVDRKAAAYSWHRAVAASTAKVT